MDFVHNPYRCGPLRVGRYVVNISLELQSSVHIHDKVAGLQTKDTLYHISDFPRSAPRVISAQNLKLTRKHSDFGRTRGA